MTTPRIEAFLYREAVCLDGGRLSAWLGLFAEDATYWVIAGAHDGDREPDQRLSLIRDDRRRLAERVGRLGSGTAPSASASVATLHLISNVLSEHSPDGLLGCASNQVIHYTQGGQAGTLPVRVEHRLRPDDEQGFLIVRKKAVPLSPDHLPGSLGFLL